MMGVSFKTCAVWGLEGETCSCFYEWKALCDTEDCITEHAQHWAPVETEGAEPLVRWRWGVVCVCVCHVFFICVDCLNVSQGRNGGWNNRSSKTRVPGRERKREGQRGREGGRDGTRDAVSSPGRGRGMWGGCSLFDLRSTGLI